MCVHVNVDVAVAVAIAITVNVNVAVVHDQGRKAGAVGILRLSDGGKDGNEGR